MTTWTALTTLAGKPAAEALREAVEALPCAPTAVGVLEIEDGAGLWEVGAYFVAAPDAVALDLLAASFGARAFAVSRSAAMDRHASRKVSWTTSSAFDSPTNRCARRYRAAACSSTRRL